MNEPEFQSEFNALHDSAYELFCSCAPEPVLSTVKMRSMFFTCLSPPNQEKGSPVFQRSSESGNWLELCPEIKARFTSLFGSILPQAV